jgi:PPOX class probable F420-dependent enzyme
MTAPAPATYARDATDREDSPVKKIPRSDPRAAHMADDATLERDELATHLSGRHQWVLATTRRDGRPQMSLVTGGMLPTGELAISTYPERAKARNIRRDASVSVLVLGDRFDDAWVQIDGDGRVVDVPGSLDAFVDYYRSISGEHPDWDEYRHAMLDQGKCMILITPTRWSPMSRGGFPPSMFED